MTNTEKQNALTVCTFAKGKITAKISTTERELKRARMKYEVYLRHVDRLEARLKRQQAELRRQNRIEQAIINSVDEYDEFYLLANEMTA